MTPNPELEGISVKGANVLPQVRLCVFVELT